LNAGELKGARQLVEKEASLSSPRFAFRFCFTRLFHAFFSLPFAPIYNKLVFTLAGFYRLGYRNESHKEVEIAVEENDFKRIEQLVSNVVDARLGRFEGEVTAKIDAKLGQLRKDVNEDFRHHVGILTEELRTCCRAATWQFQ